MQASSTQVGSVSSTQAQLYSDGLGPIKGSQETAPFREVRRANSHCPKAAGPIEHRPIWTQKRSLGMARTFIAFCAVLTLASFACGQDRYEDRREREREREREHARYVTGR